MSQHLPNAITYTRSATKVQALLNRLNTITDAIEIPAPSPEEAARAFAVLGRDLRAAKRAFEANSRSLDAVDSLINNLY